MDRFEDHVVIVTGSTQGIGKEIAKRFHREGAAVVVTGRSNMADDPLVADNPNVNFVRADLRNRNHIEQLITETVSTFGRIDCLVNNAAVQTETSTTELSIEDWRKVLETDFRAYWECAKRVVNHMDRGSIINISSNHAFQTMPAHFPYNAVKAGINGMTRAMALDLGPRIRVNTVNPGWIAVDRTVGAMSADERESLEAIHPLGRIGEPADVAGVVAFLASDDAAFMTGSSIVVDGGRSAVLQDDTLPDYHERRTSTKGQ